MKLCCALLCTAVIGLESAFAQAVIEGRVELPKTSAAPVMDKRYEIVTKDGALATKPPLAVVYLEGSFPKAKATAEKEVLQKDLLFEPRSCLCRPGREWHFRTSMTLITTFFPYRRPSVSTSGATDRTRNPFLQWSWIRLGW